MNPTIGDTFKQAIDGLAKLRKAKEAHDAACWARLSTLFSDATMVDPSRNLRNVLEEAADLEYELTGDCKVVGPILDALTPDEG